MGEDKTVCEGRRVSRQHEELRKRTSLKAQGEKGRFKSFKKEKQKKWVSKRGGAAKRGTCGLDFATGCEIQQSIVLRGWWRRAHAGKQGSRQPGCCDKRAEVHMRLGRMRCLSRASGVSKPCLARDEVDGDFEEKGTEKKLLLGML